MGWLWTHWGFYKWMEVKGCCRSTQFPFQVLMEELVGVGSCITGDMASRTNFGLNELDFVFSTLVVASILNLVLIYLLALTLSSSTQSLPGIFASSPASHMFEPGPFSLMNRLGTCIYKGSLFAAVGFAGGLVGTGISNGLINMRKKAEQASSNGFERHDLGYSHGRQQ